MLHGTKGGKAALWICVWTLLLGGCMYSPVQTRVQPATISAKPVTYLQLISLPQPRGRIPVAVYNFRDQTGQYKPQANVSSFSTAVTQGATSILVQALGESRWFIPVEREGLQNILTERKIIRAAQSADENKEEAELPPLLTSSIVLEGGIVGYDTNINTGGLGLGYYGFNVGELYRTDQVTVYLRAVDVRTGRVLVSVSTHKTVLSQEIRTGLFRYVSLNRLAEMEAGVTTNEPIYTCVLQAIQKAVVGLVIEGIQGGVWMLKDPDDFDMPVIRDYLNEKNDSLQHLISASEDLQKE